MRTLYPRIPAIVGFLTFLSGVLVLEVLSRQGIVSPFILPPPSQIASAGFRVAIENDLGWRLAITLGEILAATFALVLIGIPVGILLHQFTTLRLSYENWVAAFAAAPIVLAYPVFFVIFGHGALTIIIIATLGGISPVILKTIEGLDQVRPVLIDVGKSLQMSKSRIVLWIMMPAALTTIFSGLKVGLIFTLVSVVGVEYLISYGGLGALVSQLSEMYDPPATFAVVAVIIIISTAFFLCVERIEAWLRRLS